MCVSPEFFSWFTLYDRSFRLSCPRWNPCCGHVPCLFFPAQPNPTLTQTQACNKPKRKAFDITEKRYEGLVDESELARIKQAQRVDEKADKQAKLDKQAKKDKWRREHEQLQGAMRANKGTGEAAVHTPDPGLVPCPHCGRKFNESSADRHIAICQSVFSKKNAAKPAAKNAGNRKYR